ncbi:hypothetical protein DXG03_007453 [Asterophora parasitica]|uniref:Xylanolytic transcriptional activator regulatory domain-containing protein n=1 Tax=Asterophora parasitica TaxID=117018 RepID=A0A9P7G804_9AGAR|nr:hypothetical protein DXG03_007453 [Asterophora parasitica]
MAPEQPMPIAPLPVPQHSSESVNPRPLKRARKNPTPKEEQATPALPPAPIDHIFITDGIIAKKTGGKKVRVVLRHIRGVLVSGKGTRFILANTEQLHTKIHEMSERIRQLEEALEGCQCFPGAGISPSSPFLSHQDDDPRPITHPLLAPQLLSIKSTMGLYGGSQAGENGGPQNGNGNGQKMDVDEEVQSGSGSRSPRREGSVEVHSHRNGNEQPGHASTSTLTLHASSSQADQDAMFEEVMKLSQTYPLPDDVSPEPNLKLRGYLRRMLPAREEAEHLWSQALQNALWQYVINLLHPTRSLNPPHHRYNPHPSETFFPNLAHHCYTSSTPDLSPRRLALLFMILAVGCLVDLHRRPPDSPDAERYHQFARAALCEIPVMEETNVETLTALFYEIWYLLVFSDKKKAAGYAWGLMGLTAKLAQSIGLHRNTGGAKVIPEEVEKRRSLFWELLYLDARLSLSLGRPPSLCINHVDCPRPSYQPDHGCDPSVSLHYYQEWKHSCYIKCLAPVLQLTSQPTMDYAAVIELDTRIRDFSFPLPLRTDAALQTRSLLMQKASLSIALEAVLLQLHRSFFTRALSGPEESFNRRHKYAPSVVAVFLSASRMIATVQDLYHREPELTARILGYWSNAFSAAVALCLLVSRAPFTCLSPAALQELERARMLFKSARDTCPRALQVIPILETMVNKANDIYNRWSNGQEVQTVLQHVVSNDPVAHEFDAAFATSPGSSSAYVSPSPPPGMDPFSRTHRSLAQCIVEVHARARALYPHRKPCSCSKPAQPAVQQPECPPSHFWAPPPTLPQTQQASPVLPNLDMEMYSYSYRESTTFLPPVDKGLRLGDGGSKLAAVVETLNFELGALSSSGEQSLMSFF